MGQDPVVLITGATRGVGRAIAEALQSTHHVLVGGTDLRRAASVARELRSADAFAVDLTDEEATERAAGSVDRLDVLVHSAGIALAVPSEGSVRAIWRQTYDVNVVAVAELTRLLLPALRASRGHVVFINSGAGLKAGRDLSGYAASKFALTAFGDALREVERGVVRVSSVHPGRVDTDMQRDLQAAAGRPYVASEHLQPGAVGAAVRCVIESPRDATIETLSIRPPH